MAYHQAGQLPEAESIYRQVLETSPNHHGVWYLLGVIACQVGQYATAVELTDKAILLKPDYAEAYHYRGIALHALRRHEAALESWDKAISLKPDLAEAYLNRGIALQALQRYAEALASYEKAIRLKPGFAEAYGNRGITLNALEQYEAAIESCDRAILLKPEFAEAHANRGNALHALRRYRSALESYDRALALNPRSAEAHNNRGSALQALQEFEAALESYDRALALNPDYADAHNNRGNALLAMKLYQAALDGFKKTLVFRPDYEYSLGYRLHMKSFLCDWENMEREAQQLEAAIGRGEKAALPFAILAISDSLEVQRRAAEIYVRDKYPAGSTLGEMARRPRRDRLRIGYFSADFYNHATSYLMAELFERHDRSRFEIVGFSFGPRMEDEMSRRVAAAMDRFTEVRTMLDGEIAKLSRDLEVDIAVDLKGFTKESRPGIFARRAAPIQVNYLGYPGTMGAGFMDYLIADHTLIPEASRQSYSEKIVYLPDSYQANDSQRPISAKACTRADESLPEAAFVYCCFNTAYKITPAVFDIWMRILVRVQGSVLWLLEDNPQAVVNLRKEAERRGIAGERLIFARALPFAEHLAREKLADLFLDTFPYNAHTTASDALFAGLPVLTRMGETFASRVAASLLRAVGLPELITATEAEFEELAVDLANDAERYRALRRRLRQNRLTAPLFDCQAFTRHIETAYTAIYDRYQAGLPPEHVDVPRLGSRP